MIKCIKFPSKWKSQYDVENTGVAKFELGLGPCGLTVVRLWYRYTCSCFVVRQYYMEGGSKDFIYNHNDITGRVEIEYD